MTNYELARAYALSTISPEILTSPALFKDWMDIMLIKFNEPRPKTDLPHIVIYTDGACSGNPGPGGYGAILMLDGYRRELSGGEAHTTNNRMELLAAVAALEALKKPCAVELYSDSSYLVNAFKNHWIGSWQKNGWRKADNKSVLNQDLWEKLVELTSKHNVTFIKVKGHADNEWNNRCDQIAVGAASRFKEGA